MPAIIAGIVGGLAFQASRPGADRLWVLVVLYAVAVALAYRLGRGRRPGGASAVAVATAEASAQAGASSSVVVNVDLGARAQGAARWGALDRAEWVDYAQVVDPVSLGLSDDPEIQALQLGEEIDPGEWLGAEAARAAGRALAPRPPHAPAPHPPQDPA